MESDIASSGIEWILCFTRNIIYTKWILLKEMLLSYYMELTEIIKFNVIILNIDNEYAFSGA